MHKHILLVYGKMSSYKKCCTLKIKRGHKCIAQVQNREGIASEDDKLVWVW